MQIEIEWSNDEYCCDDCGPTWATGAVVRFDGEVVINQPALAHCYGGSNISEEDTYKLIIEKLGHQIAEQYA